MSNIEIYRMKKRKEARRRKKMVRNLLKLTVISGMLMAAILFFVLKSPVQAREEARYYKYYNTVRVEKGDSLWGYAKLYSCGSNKSVDAYIDEVCSINHIAKNATLRTGTTLTIPYYSTEYKCGDRYL